MRRLRLMLVISSSSMGGGELMFQLLAQYLDQNRVALSLVTPPAEDVRLIAQERGARYIPLDVPRRLTLRTIRALRDAIREVAPDIIHTQFFHADLLAWLATRGWSPRPLLLTTICGINYHWEVQPWTRKARYWISSRLYRGIYRSFDGVATPSHALKWMVCTRPGLRVSPDQVTVIPNGIDVRGVAGAAGAGKPGGSTVRVIMVANFVPVKGHMILVRSLQRLAHQRSLECLMVGMGETEPLIRRMVQQAGLSQVVRFLGARTDVPRLLQQSDVCVLPSYWEGFGNVVLEAMAVGTPIVATSVGGIPEMITNGDTGLLVPPSDPDALAEAIERLLDDSSLRERIRINACRLVANNFDVRHMVAQYEAWYSALLARHRRQEEPIMIQPKGIGPGSAAVDKNLAVRPPDAVEVSADGV
jgi:glycosyltransferase involved in cell wall biosynthesis